MPRQPAVGPLAQSAMADLALILRGTPSTARSTAPSRRAPAGPAALLEAWIREQSQHVRPKQRQVLAALAVAAGDRLAASSVPVQIWRPDVPRDAASAELLRGRLVAAYLNDDPPTFDALVDAWASWHPDARGEVLRDLIRVIGPL
ncbi:hypothetical protein [Microbacterium radiodurans]|uniref:Uncharacterized protein n=1 Tax=Microbacterium radiodurans TaxID=661398 RepID=A0A5J5IWW5_9MICO|nr:hypothetical protein [Microbacterium radiodurans]KAA9089070.1 hypothetical protein F6B42_00755 [Microbacterium radiodurans]